MLEKQTMEIIEELDEEENKFVSIPLDDSEKMSASLESVIVKDN